MLFELDAVKDSRIKNHNGIFTRSYQEARSVYDSLIRKWTITFDGYFFTVENEKQTERVFVYSEIQNCSCKNFIENQCGTCMHIEAVLRIPNIRSITKTIQIKNQLYYLDSDCLLKKRFVTLEGQFLTPAVNNYLDLVKSRKTLICDAAVENVNTFTDFGINLFDFQQESIKKMIKLKRNVLVLKMGLGKTLCALACCKILNKQKILIIVPNNLKYQWQREINKFGLGTSLVVSKGPELKNYTDQKFLIISYEMLNHNKSFLEDNTFEIAILDEIQKIKNPESVTWSTISKLKSDFAFALSGTPIQNSMMDLLSIIKVINPYEMLPEWKFYEYYCDCSRAKLLGVKKHKVQEIRDRFAKYIINPTIDLKNFPVPTKIEHKTIIKLTTEQMIIHDGFMDRAKPLLAKSLNYSLSFGEKAALNGLLTKARLAAVDARLVLKDKSAGKSDRFIAIESKISELVKIKKEKVIVFSEWILSLDLLQSFLIENDIGYVLFNGNLTAKDRDNNLVKFINDPKICVLLSTDSGGIGIDGLQFAANNIIHTEPLWNPMRLEQRNGRLVRALQKSPNVDIFYYNSNYGVEDLINTADARKRTLISDVFQ